MQNSAKASCPNPGAGLALRRCRWRASAGIALLHPTRDRSALRASLGSRLTAGLSRGAQALARGAWKLLHGPQHRKSTHHLIRRGAGARRARVLLAAPPHPSPARAPGVTQLAPPPPPAPGRQRARAQSPPGRRRSGEAAACAVDRAGGAHCGDGPRDAPDSHLLLLLPPLPAGLPIARDHLRYVLE